MFQHLRNVNQQVWIALGSTLLIGASAYPVFFKETRPGHEIFSSEKPEAIRIAQEERRDEYRRRIKEQRQELQKQAALTEAKSRQ